MCVYSDLVYHYCVLKILQRIMQFVYLRACVPLYLVCGSDFFKLGSTFCRNAQKRGQKQTGKNLNVDRQFFKNVISIFDDTLFNLIVGDECNTNS